MVALLDAAAGHHLYLAPITEAEVITAMRRPARLGEIVATDVAAALTQFRQDFSRLYRMIEMAPTAMSVGNSGSLTLAGLENPPQPSTGRLVHV